MTPSGAWHDEGCDGHGYGPADVGVARRAGNRPAGRAFRHQPGPVPIGPGTPWFGAVLVRVAAGRGSGL